MHSQLADKSPSNIFGVTPEQAQDLKKLLVKAILGDTPILP